MLKVNNEEDKDKKTSIEHLKGVRSEFKITSDFTKLTENDVREVQSVLTTDIYRNKMRLETYEKYAHINADLVEEVIGIKDYIGQLTKAKFYIDFIMLMVEESDLSYSRSSEICCTIQ
jgi:hypothetical protein